MKKIHILILILSTTLLTAKDLLSSQSKTSIYNPFNQLDGDLLGESYNFNGKAQRGAIAYGLANTGGFSESNIQGGYIKPEMIAKLPDKIDLPRPGPLETVEEVYNE